MTELNVTDSYLEMKAEFQGLAAENIGNAKSDLDDIVSDLLWAHGLFFSSSREAIAALQSLRQSAAETMQQVAEGLAANLRAAEVVYSDTDTDNAGTLDEQMQ